MLVKGIVDYLISFEWRGSATNQAQKLWLEPSKEARSRAEGRANQVNEIPNKEVMCCPGDPNKISCHSLAVTAHLRGIVDFSAWLCRQQEMFVEDQFITPVPCNRHSPKIVPYYMDRTTMTVSRLHYAALWHLTRPADPTVFCADTATTRLGHHLRPRDRTSSSIVKWKWNQISHMISLYL